MQNKTVIAKKQIGKTSLQVDTLGFGCAPLGNLYHAISDDDAKAILTAAWQAGFRYFDTAPHYGQGLSERRTGDLLRHLKGKDYILSTKVGRLLKPAGYAKKRHGFVSPMPFDIKYDYSYDGVMRSFEDSVLRLGLDRIDVLYMHDIGRDTHGEDNNKHFPIAMQGGYKAMDELRRQGLIRAIGLGVNEYEVCEQAMDHGDWDCFLLAGRYSLLEQQSLQSFLPKCEQRNCSIIIGGPYNSGILATGVKGPTPPHYNYAAAPKEIVDRVSQIEDVCQQYDVTLAAAALQFPLAHPSVASVIPGLGNVSRIQKTLDLFHQRIPAEFWQTLKEYGLLDENAPIPAAKW
jgi:D-threo-aldose 1-dehydrogenase